MAGENADDEQPAQPDDRRTSQLEARRRGDEKDHAGCEERSHRVLVHPERDGRFETVRERGDDRGDGDNCARKEERLQRERDVPSVGDCRSDEHRTGEQHAAVEPLRDRMAGRPCEQRHEDQSRVDRVSEQDPAEWPAPPGHERQGREDRDQGDDIGHAHVERSRAHAPVRTWAREQRGEHERRSREHDAGDEHQRGQTRGERCPGG